MLKGIKEGGSFLFNSIWDEEETKKRFPDHMKKTLAEKNINVYIINATKIAEEIGLGGRTNTIMQSAFFKVADVIPYEKSVKEMKDAILKSYGSKGENIVNMNYAAVDQGGDVIKIDVPADWANLEIKPEEADQSLPPFIRDIMMPINAMKGDDLPVSTFTGREDGTFPAGTTAYEKRGIAVNVPEWISGNCIQCNQCSYVCPHAAIRPFLLDEKEAAAAPAGTDLLQGIGGTKEYKFRMQVSPLDCTGCGNCVDVCPSKTKSLEMKPLGSQEAEIDRWNHMHEKVGYKDTILEKSKTVKNSQFAQPLFEFSGACAGCGETPYVKAITQLYGERMVIANATGCSSIYGGSAPATPYCKNLKTGFGPAWANSLFEDNAEFGYGIGLGINQMRSRIYDRMQKAIAENKISKETKAAFDEWIDNKDKAEITLEIADKVVAQLKKENDKYSKEILSLEQFLAKKSVWIFGGDGWAYDIGYGGLDHVIASGEDVNILVMDTEVYSNTGGQASKATPVGAVAKFAASGMRTRKKDLGAMAMTYGYVYVAQVAMGSNQNQYFKALKEAEAYPGPSLIIAYAPCIAHGPKGGMGQTQMAEKKAVEAGYWHNYRYNPLLEAEGKNPFILDSKEPDWTKFQEFLHGEVRYTSLLKSFPQDAERLFKVAEDDAKWRYSNYANMAKREY